MSETSLSNQVLNFYKELPFNTYSTPESSAENIKKRNIVTTYSSLNNLLSDNINVLEVGCGAGQLSNSIAYYYDNVKVKAIDFNSVAIDKARATSSLLGNRNIEFDVEDLFLYEPDDNYDVIISVGVLHHTEDCEKAVKKLASLLSNNPNGKLFIGLYHLYGRKPFLDHFQSLREKGVNDELLYSEFSELFGQHNDETFLRSWFRDQVLHPHETQHTLKEVSAWIADYGYEVISTSLNREEPFTSLNEIFSQEVSQEKLSKQRLKENKYFPGFFTFLAAKDGK